MKKKLSSFSFIFVGQTHGFIDDFKKQKEIIELVKPEFVLSENLQDLVLDSEKKYTELLSKKEISETVSFKEVKNLLELCKNNKIKLIGMDFKNFGFDSNIQKIIKGEKIPTEKDKEKIEEIIKDREKHHSEIILKYENQTKKPIVILLGAGHLQENTHSIKDLNNYIIFLPCDENGNPLFMPSENKSTIKYLEIIK